MRAFSRLLCSGVLICGSLSGAQPLRSQSPEAWNPDDTAPTPAAVAAAAKPAQAIKCTTSSCQAVIVIDQLVQIADFAMAVRTGFARLEPDDRPRIAGHRLDHVLLNHQQLFRPVCATGARIISRFGHIPDIDEITVPAILLINAVDMDLRNHGQCTEQLLASLPNDRLNDQERLNDGIRVEARDFCSEGFENHHRPKSACNLLIKGVYMGHLRY